MTVEKDMKGSEIPVFENADALLDLNLFYIRQIGASLQKHVGIQDKLEREIKLRDGASRMLAACTHEDQLLEVAKTLHTSNARMYTYMAELQKLKTAEIMEKAMDDDGFHTELKICNGRVAISDIRIPLMWSDAAKFSGAKVKEFNRYAVFCLIRVGSEVQDTELVCMDKSTTDLNFRDVLVFEDAAYNFKMDIEIHAFPMSGEQVSAPTPQKLLSRLNRSIGKSEGKRIRERLKESPATNMNVAPQYEKLGSLTLDLTCIDDHIKSHDITKVILPSTPSMRTKPLLPLYGSLTCRLVAQPKCVTEKDVGKGLPCWSYMWCEVKGGKMLLWSNPEDIACKEPQCAIDIMPQDVKVQEIEKARQKRPNSFQIRDIQNRRMFSASTRDEMTRWIRNLRQHRSDCTAWSKAYLPNEIGARPMFIASPAPYNSPCKLLFDPAARRTIVYEQLSTDSPTKFDTEPISVGDLVKTSAESPQSPSADAEGETSQSTSPWVGLFNGALNKSASKVTKLRDVQNIMNGEDSKKSGRLRTKSFDGILTSLRSTKQKKESSKPPIPRRPSEERLRERQKHLKSPTSAIHATKIESLKSCFTSESCSETYPSDVGLSSDDVFLSSDDNLLNSTNTSKQSGMKKKGKKKRKAPLPPLTDSNESQNGRTKPSSFLHPSTKASLSSASSLEDVLDRKKSAPRKPPRPEAPSAKFKSSLSCLWFDSDGRQSQLSVTSNRTQLSNASSGYKSDSEGLSSAPKSPYTGKTRPSEQHHYEVVILDEDLHSKKDKTRIRVLPHHLPSIRSGSVLHTRSQSLGSEATECNHDDLISRSSLKSSNSSINEFKFGKDKLTSRMMSSVKYEHPKSPLSLCQKPIPAPRRSYLTAVESSKVSSPSRHLYDEPPDPPNSNEDPNYDDLDALFVKPTPKSMRAAEISATDGTEPIYAQVDKSRKAKHGHSRAAHIKLQESIKIESKRDVEVIEETSPVYV